MVEIDKKEERFSYMKEKVQREVFRVFQNGKDSLDISRRMDILLQRDIPQILEDYNIRGKEERIQDILYESLKDIYDLDTKIDEKSLMFLDTLSDTFNSRLEYVIHSENEEELGNELSNFSNILNFRYYEKIKEFDKDTIRKEDDVFTHEPDFKREIRTYLISQGITDEEMLSDIEKQVKSVAEGIYDEYHHQDIRLEDAIKDICDQEIGEFKRDVSLIESGDKEQVNDSNTFKDLLRDSVNSDDEIARAESREDIDKKSQNRGVDEKSLPGNLLM